jgi:murein DD-endopeptidase MepM/ murein hydrolase activator NlpD
MYLTLVMVTRLRWPDWPEEFVLPNPLAGRDLRKWSHEHWLVAGMFVFIVTALIAIVPGFANAMRNAPSSAAANLVSLALPLPAPKTDAASSGSGWEFVRIRSGETLGVVFQQLKLPATLMQRLLERTSAKRSLTHLREGQELAFELDSNGQLKTLRFDADDKNRVDLKVSGDTVTEAVQERLIERRVELAAGTITRSLYADGARAGLTNGAIIQMANIFKYDIDFVEDVRGGDSFQVVYEELWRDGQRIGTGDVVAATFTNRGKRITAYAFKRDGKIEYFDDTGRPLKKGLMRIPIEFARLSSTFGMRKHPVLGRMRAHKGVDYAARTGTPIMAAGDARVSFVGWKNGYGRAVILDHGQGRTTLYGHMSAWGKEKVGQHVSQGSTIGYVGMSGLATGPHLHYEFRVNGTQVNPLTVTMPKPKPLAGAELIRFRAATAPAVAKLLIVEKNTRLASR